MLFRSGFSYVDNKVRSAYGFIQNETWGGVDPRGASFGAAAVPDDFFKRVSLPDKFKGVQGWDNPGVPQAIYTFDFARMAELLRSQYNICSNPQTGTASVTAGEYLVIRWMEDDSSSFYRNPIATATLSITPAPYMGGQKYNFIP